MKTSPKHIVFFLLIFPFWLNAQEIKTGNSVGTVLESIIESLEDESGESLILEDMEQLAENPLNINTASASEFSKLHLLDEIQIQNLLNYREQFGPVYSIFELNTIDGFSAELLQKMEPFIFFGPEEKEQKTFSESMKYGRHQLLFRTLGVAQIPKGYQPKEDGSTPYKGNRFRYYSRYRFEAGEKLSLGFTAEKDPGEAFFRGSNKSGFDFYSGHFSAKISRVIENVTVGDFLVRSGQGLVLWQGFSMSKSVNATEIFKTNQGSRLFTSTDENGFFRGISTTLNFGDVKLNLFYSAKNSDANLIFTDSVATEFSSLQTSGYHRTENEIADEKTVKNTNVGAVAGWRLNRLKLGATFVYQKFGLPFVRSDQLYNQYRFSGKENFSAGVDYLYTKGKYQWFGEAAVSQSKGKAFLQGTVAHLHDRVDLSFVFRHFDKNYQALWAAPFSESSSAENETGLYVGTRILPVKFVTLSAYTDFYHHEWFTYSTAGPANGTDIFLQADFRFSEKTEFYFRYKNEVKDQKTTLNERQLNQPEQTRKMRLHFQFQPSEKIIFKTRIEHSFFKTTGKENGILVFQDVKYSLSSLPLNISTRFAWFSTKSYNSRIYAYEDDLLYTFSVPAFFGTGFRGYLNFKYSLGAKIDFWLKIGQTIWNDREIIGSGYDEIAGNKKTELKFQFRLKM